ncbi:MAG: hypothetical protein PHV85_03745 [Desulfovibrionaceae bacterium]|nr:hypothetical protein [Desulfovibrionaceae bacterium]
MSRTLKLLLFAAALAALACCGRGWVNTLIADPARSDEIFKRDQEFCQRQAQDMAPTAPENDPTVIPETCPQAFIENMSQEDAFERCMRGRGWRRPGEE